jgi:hypothetical protein
MRLKFITKEKNEDDEVIELEVIIGIRDASETGWFELSDKNTGGDIWYEEGALWFNGKDLIEYDGVSILPACISNKLTEFGYEIKTSK